MAVTKKKLRRLLIALDPSEKNNVKIAEALERIDHFLSIKLIDGRDGTDGRDGKDGTKGSQGGDGKDGVSGKDGKDANEVDVKGIENRLRRDVFSRLPTGGGNMNRQILAGGTDPLQKFTDIDFIGGLQV